MSEYKHVVSLDEQGSRLDALLATLPEVLSRSAAVKLIERENVFINGELGAKRRIVIVGDKISYHITPKRPKELIGEPIPLDIRFEDEHLIVLSKQPNLVCHPAHGHMSGTLVNALIAHCGYENLAQLQGEDRPGIVHRLDQNTSGLMLVAKSDLAGEQLRADIRSKAVKRAYLTLVHNYIAPDTGLIDAPIARGGADRQRMVVSFDGNAKSSVTTFNVLERFEAGRFDEGYTFIECKLFTGRTHQIRVHLEYIGHPCVGDPLYGRQNRPKAQMGLGRQFLHSYRLQFTHPVHGEEMLFLDGLPKELDEAYLSIAELSMGKTARGEEVFADLVLN